MVFDVGQDDFEARVIERSREVPVVVDFWAEWCGPCRALSPALEAAARSREGEVDLVKVDTDANQELAIRYRVQGIPAVKAFRDGEVVSEFTGAIPPPQVEQFFDSLGPSEADQLVEQAGADGDEEALRRALALDLGHTGARRALGQLLLRRGETEEALRVLEAAEGDFVAEGLAARARLADDEELQEAFAAWDDGDPGHALELLQDALATTADDDRRDQLRRVMVAIFTELGADHPLAREHRRRLATALN